jgi:hypothetical protein
MATTTNFGWETPDDTDLVKDGALAIRTLGSAIDTSLVDLKGGTTGQVLSKTSNTDMDFTWVTSDDANAIQNAIVDAKGDLIAASAADTPARLAVGNNGESLVADSSATTGLRWQGNYTAGKNIIINGGFDIWQRGTSFALTSALGAPYTADRWTSRTDGATAQTYSRQTTSDTTNLPQIQYCMRVARNSGSTSTALAILETSLETVNSIPFAGQTVTLSFYARRGANFSGSSNQITANLKSGTGTDQLIGSSYTGSVTAIGQTPTLTTTWQRFSYNATIATTATELGLQFYYTPSGTAGAADYFEITGVQLEIGSVATTFSRAGGTLGGELSACQRYYQRFPKGSSTNGGPAAIGYAVNTGTVLFQLPTLVEMRTTPTAIDSSGMRVTDSSNTNVDGATFTLEQASPTNLSFYAIKTASFTATRLCILTRASTTNDYIGFSAEL